MTEVSCASAVQYTRLDVQRQTTGRLYRPCPDPVAVAARACQLHQPSLPLRLLGASLPLVSAGRGFHPRAQKR